MLARLYGLSVCLSVKLEVLKPGTCFVTRSAIQETRMKCFMAHFNASCTRGRCFFSFWGGGGGALIGTGYEIITR
jgi:hypothetical protein